MNWKLALGGALVVLPLLAVLALGFNEDPHAVPFVLGGHPAPSFELDAVDGQKVSLAALHGRPVVLNFWATWCYPCQAEHGLLQEAARHYGPAVQFLGLVYQDQPTEVRKYLQKHVSAYPHLLDPESRVAIDYGVAGVPESFIIGPDGRILHKEAGVLSAATLHRVLDPLLPPARG